MTADISERPSHGDELLPPVVTGRARPARSDDALGGAPLPPYRPGLHPARLIEASAATSPGDAPEADVEPPVTGWAAWEEPSEVSEQEAVETWDARRAAWEAEAGEPTEDEADDAVDWSIPVPADDADATTDTTYSAVWPFGDPVAPSHDRPEPPSEPRDDAEDVDSGAVADDDFLLPAAAPWEQADDAAAASTPDSDAPAEDDVAEPAVPGWDDSWSGADMEESLDLPPLPDASEAHAAAGDDAGGESVDDWLAQGAASQDFPYDLEPEDVGPLPARAAFETPGPQAGEASAGPVDAPVWDEWDVEAEDAVPPSEEEAPAWSMGGPPTEAAASGDAAELEGFDPFAYADEEDAGADEPFPWHDATSEADEPGRVSDPGPVEEAPQAAPAPPGAVDDEPAERADERVAVLPPTPLDSWFHSEEPAEAAATWEAFGRALEEAASWGDLGTTIATGHPPGRIESEPPEVAAEAGEPDAPPPAHAQAPSEDAMAELAGRLELLARRLRQEGEKGVEHAMSEGDRLEASLAGFIAGYVAARRG